MQVGFVRPRRTTLTHSRTHQHADPLGRGRPAGVGASYGPAVAGDMLSRENSPALDTGIIYFRTLRYPRLTRAFGGMKYAESPQFGPSAVRYAHSGPGMHGSARRILVPAPPHTGSPASMEEMPWWWAGLPRALPIRSHGHVIKGPVVRDAVAGAVFAEGVRSC